MTVWQVPDNTTDSIRYYGIFQPDDVTASNQDADIPYRWTEAMCSGLAAKVCLKLPGIPDSRIALLLTQAETSFKYAADEEGEKAALRIIPV